MIAVVDYGAGNLHSVCNALNFLGAENEVTADAARIRAADAVLLPGVGAFGDAMAAMRVRGLAEVVTETARDAADADSVGGKPFLGICLGMQLLFDSSQESPGVPGLSVFPGEVLRIPALGLKVPHIGWNSLTLTQPAGILHALPPRSYVYFVHSYYLKAANRDIVAAKTQYAVEIDAAIAVGKLFASQFHPEKSGDIGMDLLAQWLKTI